MKLANPSRMPAADRVAELGELLAAGIQRFLAAERKQQQHLQKVHVHLDALGAAEAQCGRSTGAPR